jgi:hypothetical protein
VFYICREVNEWLGEEINTRSGGTRHYLLFVVLQTIICVSFVKQQYK